MKEVKEAESLEDNSMDAKAMISYLEKPVSIEIEVLDKYSGDKNNDVYISDMQFTLESNIPQGR